MNTKTKWIIFMAVVLTFSVLWPITYMLKGSGTPGAQNNTSARSTNQVNILRPLVEYTASFNANVTKVYPVLLATGYSNYGDPNQIQKIISKWGGVKSVNVTRTQTTSNPNYMYQFLIKVNLTSAKYNPKIGFWLKKLLPIKVDTVLTRVNISFPKNVTFTSKSGMEQTMKVPKNTTTLGYYYVEPGKNPVYMYLAMSGDEPKQSLAIAGNRFYLPPLTNYKMNITGNVTNVTTGVVIAKVPYGTSLNDTNLSKAWNATVSFFPPLPEVICPNNTSIPSGINYTESDGNYIIKFNKSEGPGDLLKRLKGCHLDTGVLRVEFKPSMMTTIKSRVAKYGNITKEYYLADVKIPKNVVIDGENRTLPVDTVSDVVVNSTSVGVKVRFPITISMAFEIPVGVSYGGQF